MNKHPNTCIHNKVRGYQALEALLAAQHRNHVCPARLKYLEGQVKKYKDWLWDERGLDEEDFRTHVLETKIKLFSLWREGEGEVSDTSVEMVAPLDEHEKRFNEEFVCLMQFEEQFQGNYTKGLSKWHQEQRLVELHMQEQLTDLEDLGVQFLKRVQQEFYGPLGTKERPITKRTWRVVKKFKKRLNDLRFKEGKLDYEEWARLSNWTNRMLSCERQYKVRDPRDKEVIWEEIAKQDLYLWESQLEQDQEEECRVLDELEIAKHYADMTKVKVEYVKPDPWTELQTLKNIWRVQIADNGSLGFDQQLAQKLVERAEELRVQIEQLKQG